MHHATYVVPFTVPYLPSLVRYYVLLHFFVVIVRVRNIILQESKVSGKRTAHELIEADGPKSKSRKRSRSCYDQLANAEGTKTARSKTRRVNTYCNTCEDKPYLCVSCFNLKHCDQS